MLLPQETIAAISTAPGVGAIAIVRLSGPEAWNIIERIFSTSMKAKSDCSNELKDRTAIHGFLQDPQDNWACVDEVVVIPYRGPNTYTGEDLVEINCHGGALVTRQVLSLCLSQGARLARQGEFTQRAFMSGRMDLTQAEAVLDLIQAKTAKQGRLALSALGGQIGEQIASVRMTLLELLTRITAGIDFPEEVGELPEDDIAPSINECVKKLQILAGTTRSGRFMREGLRLSIVGRPNAGKSSLLNQLLNFERAIVTDVPGTTRDSIEELIDINGVPVILIDTAGIRTTDDTVEKIGIERTKKAIVESDLILVVVDVTAGWGEEEDSILQTVGARPHIAILNKIDIQPDFESLWSLESWGNGQNYSSSDVACIGSLKISAKLGQGMDDLSGTIESWVLADTNLKESGGSLNQRQGELCERAIEALRHVEQTLASGMPQDCLSVDLKSAVDSLCEISGTVVTEEVITNVFASFCIGK